MLLYTGLNTAVYMTQCCCIRCSNAAMDMPQCCCIYAPMPLPLGFPGAECCMQTNEGLDDLDITRTGVDMPGIAAICATMRRNSTLQTLRMGDTVPFQSVEAEMGSHLGRMLQFNSSLKSLDISKIKLRDEGLEVLCQAMVKYNRSLTSLTRSRI